MTDIEYEIKWTEMKKLQSKAAILYQELANYDRKIKCSDCGWNGRKSELIEVEIGNEFSEYNGTTFFIDACPKCKVECE